MEIKNENLFHDIQQKILKNLYEEDSLKIELRIREITEHNEFSIELKVNSPEVNINFDTRVAIEQHKHREKKEGIHVQADIKKTTLEFFKSGELHIYLDVKTEEELLKACKGFSFCAVEILEKVEDLLKIKKHSIVNHFFASSIKDFRDNKEDLHQLMFHSLKNDLIELKGHKSMDYTELTQIRKMFLLMRIFHNMPLLQPVFKEPVYQTFIQIPEIKRLDLSLSRHEKNILKLIDDRQPIEKFTHEKYISEIK